MTPVKRQFSKEEFAQRGDTIFENDVRPQLKPTDLGKFVAVDIETGDFDVDTDEARVYEKLRSRLPAAQIWIVRNGSRAVHRFGGHGRRETP